jgi:hypothetical protein
MSQHILYAYVDGANLELVAPLLEAHLQAFVSGRRWVAGEAWIVNQRDDPETSSQPGDLPLWDLGLNLLLPNPGAEPPRWLADVEAIAQCLARLHGEFGTQFVLRIADVETGITDDLFYISTSDPDVEEPTRSLGVGDVDRV